MSRRDLIRARIMARVTVTEDGCWLWTGPDSGAGRGGSYPRMNLDGGTVAVHKVMWIVENGPIPPRKQIDHRCWNRMCVRPHEEHCVMTTHLRNQRLRAAHARMRCDEPGAEECIGQDSCSCGELPKPSDVSCHGDQSGSV